MVEEQEALFKEFSARHHTSQPLSILHMTLSRKAPTLCIVNKPVEIRITTVLIPMRLELGFCSIHAVFLAARTHQHCNI